MAKRTLNSPIKRKNGSGIGHDTKIDRARVAKRRKTDTENTTGGDRAGLVRGDAGVKRDDDDNESEDRGMTTKGFKKGKEQSKTEKQRKMEKKGRTEENEARDDGDEHGNGGGGGGHGDDDEKRTLSLVKELAFGLRRRRR